MPKGFRNTFGSAKITAADIKDWVKECAFPSDAEACQSIGVPFRTFGRWKANGVPSKTPAARLFSKTIEERMLRILERRREQGKA